MKVTLIHYQSCASIHVINYAIHKQHSVSLVQFACFNNSGAETEIFPVNRVNNMDDDDLVPYFAGPLGTLKWMAY